LLALDPHAERQPAVERAAWLAEKTGAALELFVAECEPAAGLTKSARDNLLISHRTRLQAIADELTSRGIEAKVKVRWDRPADEAVIRRAVESEAAVVVKDTHYHSLLKRTLFSNVDWNLIRHCPVPLWLVKDRPLVGEPRLLAAVDPARHHDKPSDLDQRILAFAQALRRAADGELHVVHVIDPVPSATVMAAAAAPETASVVIPSTQETMAERADERSKAFERLVDDASIQPECAHIERGPAADLLVSRATQLEADFVVMGAVSRSRLQNVFIGHTAERVLDRLPCDLMVVKPSEFAGATAAH
jgi:universal stress protein E